MSSITFEQIPVVLPHEMIIANKITGSSEIDRAIAVLGVNRPYNMQDKEVFDLLESGVLTEKDVHDMLRMTGMKSRIGALIVDEFWLFNSDYRDRNFGTVAIGSSGAFAFEGDLFRNRNHAKDSLHDELVAQLFDNRYFSSLAPPISI